MLSWLRSTRTHDFFAALGFRITGVFVIVCVFGMLGMLVLVSAPLFKNASATRIAHISLQSLTPNAADHWLAIGLGDWQEVAYALNKQGEVLFFSPTTGHLLGRQALRKRPRQSLTIAQHYGAHRFSLLWADGSMTLGRVVLRPVFDAAGKRTITYRWQQQAQLPAPRTGGRLQSAFGRVLGEQSHMRVNFLPAGQLPHSLTCKKKPCWVIPSAKPSTMCSPQQGLSCAKLR